MSVVLMMVYKTNAKFVIFIGRLVKVIKMLGPSTFSKKNTFRLSSRTQRIPFNLLYFTTWTILQLLNLRTV